MAELTAGAAAVPHVPTGVEVQRMKLWRRWCSCAPTETQRERSAYTGLFMDVVFVSAVNNYVFFFYFYFSSNSVDTEHILSTELLIK